MEPIQSTELFSLKATSNAPGTESAETTSLGDRLVNLISKGNTDLAAVKAEIYGIIKNPESVSNPQLLMRYHALESELTLHTTAAKTFATKASNFVEMLVKS